MSRRTPSYDDYEHLRLTRPTAGLLLVTIDRPDRRNAQNERLHGELARIWRDIDDDPETNVAVVTGAGSAFSAGGDFEMIERQIGSFPEVAHNMKDAADIVRNMIDCDKPIISAINGDAVGAGLAVALLADISIIATDARLGDGHLRLGVAAGDHAAIIWPLLCGMAKAKYHLLTGGLIDGREAERIGLVSRCVETPDVLPVALEIGGGLAAGPQHALRWTKRTMNHWLRDASAIFDASLAYELLGFFDVDVREGLDALREHRRPEFPSARA
jgi:enoyl-CoA hydratase